MRQPLFRLPTALISAGLVGAGLVGAGFVGAGIVGAGIVAAQQPPGQPADAGQEPAVTFRTEANFVEVHAIVTDQSGAFVRDLTSEDFEIYEDGQPQTPAVFSLVDLPVVQPFTPADADGPIEPDVRATTGPFDGRLYILLLDDLHTSIANTDNVSEVARGFIDEYLGVDDLGAIVFTSGRQDAGQVLTGNRRLLKEAVDRFQGRKLPSPGAEKMAVHIGRQNLLIGDEEQQRTNEGLQNARTISDPFDQERAFNVRRALRSISAISNWLGDVQGRRKALLFFSEGFDYDVYQPFSVGREGRALVSETRQATAAAQRANVTVYGIDPRGMSNFGGMIQVRGMSSDYPQLDFGNYAGQLDELLLAQESLMTLSDETGGLSIVNSNDLAGGLGRIVLDNSRYYLLGYYSDSNEWSDNRFMEIDVRVNRPGLEVRARKGFLPPDLEAVETAREEAIESGASPAMTAALGKPVPLGDLPMRVFAGPLRGVDGNGSVVVAIEIDGTSLRFEERDGRFVESVEVSVRATDERGRVRGGEDKTFDLNLMPETHDRISRSGVRVMSELPLPPGRYQIRVGGHEATGGAIGTVPYDLVVPNYDEMPFALSGVFLTSSDADSFATGNEDVDWNGLLPSPPAVTRTFSASETLTWFAEVYDDSSPAPHAILYTTTVQEATSGQTLGRSEDNRTIAARAGRQGHGFTTSLPLEGFPPGLYVLRVAASSTIGDHSASQDILFEVR